ncbi:NUDIX hydrolase [Bifidobacterium callitrichidarum]|uniref:Nudix hydrolase domain-containing protein n=1 Tax=Bifidobacterium callitrichidarum TaxID=2052941 RepID=A0A2U2NCD4_9BIFI|nr:NUDIX hydrolase [Bifidobacterium callitrichidarum]PWG66694.1 hypothetical protein DF196_01970 [Bifidobacterium callitrichidarum]
MIKSEKQFNNLAESDKKLEQVISDYAANNDRMSLIQAKKYLDEILGTPTSGDQIRVWSEPRFHVSVWKQNIRADGRDFLYHYAGFATSVPGVVIVPINDHGETLLAWHYRPANHTWSLELPRGAGEESETPEKTAQRELMEETGLEPHRLVEIGRIHADGGILQDDVRIVVAYDCVPVSNTVDFELKHPVWCSRNEINRLRSGGLIDCALTLSALSLAGF